MRIVSKETNAGNDIISIDVRDDEINELELLYDVNSSNQLPIAFLNNVATITIPAMINGDVLEVFTISNTDRIVFLRYLERGNLYNSIQLNINGVFDTDKNFTPTITTVTNLTTEGEITYSETNIKNDFLDNYNRGFSDGFIFGKLL